MIHYKGISIMASKLPTKTSSKARKDDQRVTKFVSFDDKMLSVNCFKKW